MARKRTKEDIAATQIIGDRIRKYRMARNLTHRALARAMGSKNTRSGAWEWEVNGRMPRLDQFLRLAIVLKTPLDKLIPMDKIRKIYRKA